MSNNRERCLFADCYKVGFQKGGFGGCAPVLNLFYVLFFYVLAVRRCLSPRGGARLSVLPELR